MYIYILFARLLMVMTRYISIEAIVKRRKNKFVNWCVVFLRRLRA